MPKKLEEECINEIIRIYTHENIPIKSLADRLNLQERTISKYLKENNIHVKSASECKRSEETTAKVVELYSSGASEQKIQDEIGICRKTIRSILRQQKVATRDQSQYRDYQVNENYFEKLNTNNKVYVLGFLYADGNVSKKKYNIQLSLQEGDKEILQKISEDMESTKPLYFKRFSKYQSKTGLKAQDQWSLTLHCRKLHQDLGHWGVIPCKTHIITYPSFLTQEQHSHFLRGVMDGDGCVHPRTKYHASVDINGTYSFCLGAKEVIEKFLPIHCSVIRTAKDRTTYRVVISGRQQVAKFLDWIYKDAELFLKRKHEIYLRDYYKVSA